MIWIVRGVWLTWFLLSCADSTPTNPVAPGGSQNFFTQTFPPSGVGLVDILFVIEDLDTVEQQNLVSNLPVLINQLESLPAGLPDVHIAVTTSSMGAGAFTSSVPRCMTPDGGRFIYQMRASPDPTACA